MGGVLYDIRTEEQAQQTLTRLTHVPISIWKEYVAQESKYVVQDDLVNEVIQKYGSMPGNYRTFEFVFSHITTSNSGCKSIQENGLLDLQLSYRCVDSELRQLLDTHHSKHPRTISITISCCSAVILLLLGRQRPRLKMSALTSSMPPAM